ncbi:uroporphyrinogen-III C-methyltransferase [Azospirillum rugosum]|uniref:uroporphyrinogen-III C-methyltransferase n=1 Tax=Azospirillum rugosum TaxID=416170 RepID=A0ABS4SSP5_9PROT|nr:uroporphyrinogen-III C-methyltransferase [Azospirillum rugosum]MBP2295565.1 uroporphyrin-III C-methyltransferase [Azospirillum rugosum]MDQ0528444.1 uroporphyrin-III C-methyltransferase [Azospirillum rugosum]
MPSAATWLDAGLRSPERKRFNFIVALRERIESVLRPRTARRVARAIPDVSGRRPHVTLVGAGPGDPDLLTIAAAKAIAQAEVILYDHLVGAGILDLARPGTELVCVGKRSGKHSHGQEAINALIEAHARTGRRVVRLKGGDPMIFGRAGEEIEHLEAAGISVSVIPGITAALGCASSAGISLTKRGVSRAVTFVTAHAREGDATEPDWARLADPKGTLAIYMGRDQARRVGRGLTAGGLPADTPVLAVENGCRPDERHHWTTLGAMAEHGVPAGDGPTLLMVGDALGVRMPEDARSSAAIHHRGTETQRMVVSR